jgi:hypothetical protein
MLAAMTIAIVQLPCCGAVNAMLSDLVDDCSPYSGVAAKFEIVYSPFIFGRVGPVFRAVRRGVNGKLISWHLREQPPLGASQWPKIIAPIVKIASPTQITMAASFRK